MIEIKMKVEGINDLKAHYAKRPEAVKKYINKAIEASIFELEKNADDGNFQFKTPRSQRTGYLQRSFKFGIITRDFFGAIGPTVLYAPIVHKNNPFMSRIASSSQPSIQKHFEDALKFIVEDVSK